MNPAVPCSLLSGRMPVAPWKRCWKNWCARFVVPSPILITSKPPAVREHGAEGVTRIYLTGGGAKLPGLVSYLADQISIPVETVNLFENNLIQVPVGADQIIPQTPLLTTAFGLALREPMLTRTKGGAR